MKYVCAWGGYGRVYTAYDFGVDLDNLIMYAYMMSFNSGGARMRVCAKYVFDVSG